MNKPSWRIMAAGLILTILISNMSSFISDGIKLEELRGSVLRLHILANSDSAEDQRLKLMVRDELLGSGMFSSAADLSEAERIAEEKLPEIVQTAEKVLRRNGCCDNVTAELADVDFDERVYGDITMPAGRYRALRIKIGTANGHNWWCVMYPPLCLPAACEMTEIAEDKDSEEKTVTDDKEAEEECFDEKELDILKKPKKYKLKFALWDKIKSVFD
ncbi:stage II sporulation protein R [Ruminococcus flavefaciens]|uniref:stage II sporulation protein R n=1 Tax=Ruminococcus flavefaciens TaxID=1265 RepID=UPI0004ADADFC|nr:stage II sporulation protein R [Ruminococcus flavefaciens]